MAFTFKDILITLIIADSRYDVLMNTYTHPKKNGKKAQMGKDLLTTFMKADPTTKVAEDNDQTEVTKVGAYTNSIVKQWLGLQQEADKEYAYGSPDWVVA